MAKLIQPFNPQMFNPEQGSGQLPVGKHKVIAYASQIKETSSKDGGYLQYDIKIIEGPNTGLSGAYRLNLYNSNQQTVEIASRQFSSLCYVTGNQNITNIEDSSIIHDIPFMVEVTPQKNDPKYTTVSRVFDVNGNEPGQQQQQQQQQQSNTGGGWGGSNNQQQQQSNNNNNGGGWGQNNNQQQHEQQQSQPNNTGGWGGNNNNNNQQASTKPAWGSQNNNNNNGNTGGWGNR